jgi:hypothetical protein
MTVGIFTADLQTVPLQPVASQTVDVTLNNQVCTINVFEKRIHVPVSRPGGIPTDPPDYEPINPIFLDLYVNDVLIIAGVICLHGVEIVRDAYLGFVGDLVFYDTRGTEDPMVSGLGTRWVLTYWPFLS